MATMNFKHDGRAREEFYNQYYYVEVIFFFMIIVMGLNFNV